MNNIGTFDLGSQKNRKLRKGIFLRVNSIQNKEILKKIKQTKLMRICDSIEYIEILELQDNMVVLKIVCRNFLDIIRNKFRTNVFHIEIKEDLNWSCETDIGKGLK